MKKLIVLLVLPLLAACSSRGNDPEPTPVADPPVQAEDGRSARCDAPTLALREDHAAVEASFNLIRAEIERARAAKEVVAKERAELAHWYASMFLPAKKAFREKVPEGTLCFMDDGAGRLTAYSTAAVLDREIKDTDTFLKSL